MTEPGEIRFNYPSVEGLELDYMTETLASGHTSSSGPFSARARTVLKEETGAHEVLLTTSCTAALELSAMLLDFKPGDTVVVPSFTFTTTALAYVRQGARILFCDIEPETLGLDPTHLETLLDDSVRAVVPVHYAGVACDVGGIRAALADRPDIALIEDNAHGLFGSWRGEPLGSLGRFATLSFHETKNIVCGEGGALLINDSADVDRARVLYDKGTDRQAFFRGQVDKYSWKDVGSSFGLADTLAAYLYGRCSSGTSVCSHRTAPTWGFGFPSSRTASSRPITCSTCCCLTPTPGTGCWSCCGSSGSTRPSTTSRCTAPTPAGGSPHARPTAR